VVRARLPARPGRQLIPEPVHGALHGARILWWVGLFELISRLGLTAFAGPTGQASWLVVAAVSHGVVGALLGAALDPWLRRRPAVLVAIVAVVVGAVGGLVDERPTVLLFACIGAGLSWIRWRYPGEPSPSRTAFRVVFFVGLAAVLVVLGGRPGEPPRYNQLPGADGPNVVVIVLDTVRRDRLSTYGYERETSPQLTLLADRGMQFEGWANACWSLPSHATTLTGRYSGSHGAHYEHGSLLDGERTLQSAFNKAGYDTVAVTGNPWVNVANGLGEGFGTFIPSWSAELVPDAFVVTRTWRRLMWGQGDKGGAWGAQAFSGWLDERPDPDRSFFAFVNIFEAHAPYHRVDRRDHARFLPTDVSLREARTVSDALLQHHLFGTGQPSEREAEVAGPLYDGSVLGADRVLGMYMTALTQRGYDDRNTVVLVTSDHGEYFGEHGLWGHVHGLYEPVLQVPFVVTGPGVQSLGSPLGPARLIDVAPTVLELAGVGREHWPDVQGRPVLSSRGYAPMIAEQYIPVLLAGELGQKAHTGDLDEFSVRRRSFRGPRFKLHARQSGPETQAWRLYDHRFGEVDDEVSSNQAEASRLLSELETWAAGADIHWPDEVGEGASVGGWEADALEALGYVQ